MDILKNNDISIFINKDEFENLVSINIPNNRIAWNIFDDDYAIKFLNVSLYKHTFKLDTELKLQMRMKGQRILSDHGCYSYKVLHCLVMKKNSYVKFIDVIIKTDTFLHDIKGRDYNINTLLFELNDLNKENFRDIVKATEKLEDKDFLDSLECFKPEKKILKK